MSKTTLEKVFSNKYVQLAALAAGGLALLRTWKKDSVSGVGRLSDYIDQAEQVNDPDISAHEYLIGLWTGSGYGISVFNVFAFSIEDALEKVVAYCEKKGYTGFFVKDVTEEDEENGSVLYVDATMEGANEPHYLYANELYVEQIGKVIENDYDGALITTADGLHAYAFDVRDRGKYIEVTFMHKGLRQYGERDWEYLSDIGSYKTLEGAKRAAKRHAKTHNFELSDKDLAQL